LKISAAVSREHSPAPVIETLELGEPRAGELLVRLTATGICQTDLHAHHGALSPLPIVLGHEGAGIVEAVGEGVAGLAPGDAVVMSGSSCGVCPSCAAHLPSYCDQAMPRNFGGRRMDGSTGLSGPDGTPIHSHFFGQSAFASHALVPQRTAVRVDASLPLDLLAALGCGVITGAGSVMQALKVGAGDSIAIFGVGGVGLSAVMAARLVEARHIVAIDTNPGRLALARELGATETFAADTPDLVARVRALSGRGMQFSFNTTTSPAVFTSALEVLAMRGVAAFVTAPRGEWAPGMFKMLAGGRMLRGILGGDAEPASFIPELIRHWQAGRFPFERLIRHYPFEAIGTAFADMVAAQVIKPVLRMS
jgi:aryl-alcohol dehydrogenase